MCGPDATAAAPKPVPDVRCYAREALTLPDKPSIAVLPFQMIPPYAEKSWFAEGIVEDIIHMLASQREIFVISRGSTLQFSQAQIDLRAVAVQLGVRYLLQGSVRRY